jgi:hypothetical protein
VRPNRSGAVLNLFWWTSGRIISLLTLIFSAST